ncbi:MAG: hypothetical protein GY927_14320 [bacterium]|nr:hypothetical protein [bacterium]
MKTYDHTPTAKLQDMLVSILAGNNAVSQINTRLRPDVALAAAWDRKQFAEQSNIAKLLDRLTPPHLEQLRQGSQCLFRRYGQTIYHDYRTHWLLLDLDLTGLQASRRAEGSCKGYCSGKRNRYGRQLVRGSVPTYHETLWSSLHPGNQPGGATLKPSVEKIQTFLGVTKAQRQRTIIRTDAGLGTDENINWLLWGSYQVLMKGYSGTRAVSLARQVDGKAWIQDPHGTRWIAWALNPPRFGRRVNVFVLRWPGKKGMRYGILLSTLLPLKPLATWHLYDGRGAAEIEIKADKQGLRLPKRRKKSMAVQEGLILLTDVAHNLLSWMHHWVLEETPFRGFGTARIVDELLTIPGQVVIKEGKLHKVALLKSHPYAESMRSILQNLLDFFGNP